MTMQMAENKGKNEKVTSSETDVTLVPDKMSLLLQVEAILHDPRLRAEGREVGQVDAETVARWDRAKGAGKARRVPDSWDQVHVLDRLEEAFATLSRTPMALRPKGHSSMWPSYAYERGDLVAQVETHELERLLRQRNRVRLPTTPAELQRMSQALNWAMIYLKDKPQQAEALQLACFWTASQANVKEQCRERNWDRRQFYRDKMEGARLVALGLIAAKVPVT
jgi:hypothetical protein